MTRARLLSLSATWLVLLLQRTPALRVATSAEIPAASRIVALLKAAVATLSSLGAVHSLAGATQFVVSSRNVIATVGTAITPVAFTVTGATIPAGSYRITGPLPPGLTVPGANANGILNGSNGLITGTPTAPGTYNISILAYQLANATGDAFGPTQIGFLVSGTASAEPAITTQPVSQSVASGVSVTLSVVATGSPPPMYQWRKNGVLIAGATGPVYTLTNVQGADAGAYTVTVSNSVGIVTSAPATVAIDAGSAEPVFTTQPQSQ